MKILIDCSLLTIGGGIQVALSLLLNIAKDNEFQSIVVATHQIDQQLPNDIKKLFYAYYVLDSVPVYKKYKQAHFFSNLEEKYTPDLVFTVFGPSIWRSKAPCIQGFALGLMFYPEVQDILNYSLIKKIKIKIMYFFKKNLFLRNSDYYIVETAVVKNNLRTLLNLDDNRIFVVENSYNPYFQEYFKKNIDEKPPMYEFNFLVPSSYYPHKNLEVLARVVDFLYARNFINIYFNFMIDKKNFEKLTKLVVNPNARYMLKNFGPVASSNLPKIYSDCDAVILPTLAESSTSAYPESFISKKTLLTSDLDFSRSLCGEAALFFDPLNVEDIVNKVITIYQDEKLRASIAEKGIKQLSRVYISAEDKWKKQKKLIQTLIQIS